MATGNTKLAARFRDMAQTLQKEIDERRRPRLENTRRRAEMAASIREDARRMEKVQAALIGLADAYEQNRVPKSLLGITTKKEVEYLLSNNTHEAAQAMKADLLALCNPDAGEMTEADKIKELERQLVGRKIDGFFPTPSPIVKWMLQCADIQPGDRVLEPSAGKGNIADLVRELHPGAQLDVIECNYTLRGILIYKGHNLIAGDCLEVRNPIYNVIVMNPPFEKLADIDHVKHAYENLLADGGRLVSIMGESAFFRSDNKAMVFRQWLQEVGGSVFNIPDGAFKESGTGVRTRMIVVDKATSHTTPAPDQEQDDEPQAEMQAAEEGTDLLAQFLDEDEDFIPVYPDDLEQPAEIQADIEEFIEKLTPEEADTLAALMGIALASSFQQVSEQAYSEAQQAEDTPSTPQPQEAAPEAEPTSTPASDDRDLQKALPGFGNDKLIHLKRTKMF